MTSKKAGAVHLRDWGGPGVPLLLTHGMAAHTHWWDPVVPHWKGALRAAAIDFRGHGDSDWLKDEAYTSERFVEDIETARRALGWERFILAGHSMGARIALDYARDHGTRLRGVVAIDFLPDPLQREHKFGKVQNRAQPVYESEELILSKFKLQPVGTLLDAEQLKALGRKSVRQTPGGWTWKFDWRVLSLPYGSVWTQLPAIDVDALIMRGEHSPAMPPPLMEKVAAELPRGRAVEIAGAHHHVSLDKPRELAEAIAAFAAGLGS